MNDYVQAAGMAVVLRGFSIFKLKNGILMVKVDISRKNIENIEYKCQKCRKHRIKQHIFKHLSFLCFLRYSHF